MRRPRGLSREEAALWARLARTVAPIAGKAHPPPAAQEDRRRPDAEGSGHPIGTAPRSRSALLRPPPSPLPEDPNRKPRALDRHGLDGSWERKLAHGGLAPDFTLDLHGLGLDGAHARLDSGLGQATALGARVVLVITGRPRPADPADRAGQRGAIRAKLLDWLAAGPHASRIAAVRPAHRRHGGAGAVYVVLRRPR